MPSVSRTRRPTVLYFRNQPIEAWGVPAGTEKAGPDQCASKITTYPTTEQVETMFPFIDPYPDESDVQQSGHGDGEHRRRQVGAVVALSRRQAIVRRPARSSGRVVAKDGVTQITGINVIARNVAAPFDAISRISGDRTQGLIGADGSFEITGLTPGAKYVVYIDQLGAGGFSTPKAVLLGPEEYWNARESSDASYDDACAASKIVLNAGETAIIRIAMNGIDRAPDFTYLPYSLPHRSLRRRRARHRPVRPVPVAVLDLEQAARHGEHRRRAASWARCPAMVASSAAR